MVWIGDNSIEIGAPFGDGSAGRGTFVERLGGGMHSVAVQVADLATTLERLDSLGVEVASRICSEIVFTRPGATAGLVLEWASHVQDDDPRWGAPLLPFVAPPVVAVERMAFVGALVRDPAVDVRRLAEVLDTPWVEYGDAADLGPDVPAAALDLGDCMLALYPVPPDETMSRAVWGGHHDRPRCIALALSVTDQGVAERALAAEGVRCTTGPTTVASCSTRARCRFPSCSRSSCSPAIPAPRGHRRADGGTRRAPVGARAAGDHRGAHDGAPERRGRRGCDAPGLGRRAASERAPSRWSAGSAMPDATPAHGSCTAPSSRVPTVPVRPPTARSSRSAHANAGNRGTARRTSGRRART